MIAYQIGLDTVHSVMRLAEEIYTGLAQIASSGGPYAAIYA